MRDHASPADGRVVAKCDQFRLGHAIAIRTAWEQADILADRCTKCTVKVYHELVVMGMVMVALGLAMATLLVTKRLVLVGSLAVRVLVVLLWLALPRATASPVTTTTRTLTARPMVRGRSLPPEKRPVTAARQRRCRHVVGLRPRGRQYAVAL